MGIFKRCQITLEFDSTVNFKFKTALKKKIIDNDGIVSFIVTKRTTHLVVNNAEKSSESYKGRMAQKYGIPIVSTSFVDDSIEKGELLEPDDFLVVGKTAAEQFQTGKIIASQQDKENSDKKKKRQKSTISLNQLKPLSWPHSTDNSLVEFDEDNYEVARYVFLKRFDSHSQLTTFTSLEIHVVMGQDDTSSHYRIFLHNGTMEKKDKNGEIGNKSCYYLSTLLDTEHVFTLLYKQFTSSPHKLVKVTFLSSHVGSDKLKKMMLDIRSSTGASEELPLHISDLVGYIWNEANGELNDVLSVPVERIKLEEVEKAEAALLSIKLILDGANKNGNLQKLRNDFYSAIPHKHKAVLDTKRMIAEKQDLCQLVRDVVSIGESTNWSTRSNMESKYRSLRCDLTVLDQSSEEFVYIRQLLLDSQDKSSSSLIEVKNIYGVHRPVEDGHFTHQLDNKQLLFHSSSVKNFVGILSRGLLLPKIVVDDFGGTRTDPGMLGSGIYFASTSSVSSQYSKPGKTRGSRLMLVNQVALGNVLETTSRMMGVTEAPKGYSSVHGLKTSDELPSEFMGDEYAIYSTSQQRIRYLVEFSLPGDVKGPIDHQLSVTGDEAVSEASDVDEPVNAEAVSLSDVQDIEDPLNKVEAGLVGGDIPLQSVHIKAKLIDLAAQVIVLQAYKNFSKKPIEAKYVFPLDDMAAVCGFEAFINGKHIVGEVKEKEQAHKEYREAISQGHGAYLMDEETPNVFTVSVGNLPPGASVLIKITYVAELLVEGENIVFSLPGSVAPWKKDAALDTTTQTDVDKVKVTKQGDVSVQVAVEMPFKIRTIESPTHKLRIKKTATKAVVEMCEGDDGLGDGFQLLVGLAEIHVPRMWVEENDQSHHACMLTFYPEFEAESIVDNEIIFCLDCSNSMKGETLVSAKKVLLLTLHHLPPKCLFNVITFGAAYDELFPSCQPKSKETVTAATNYIQDATATMGSTDVWRPLRSLLLLSSGSGADSSTLPPRNLFLVTDGHMTEEQPTLQAIRQAIHTTRVFTFGVGKTANRHFLKSMARVGAGYEEFFDPKTKSKWQRKVKSQLNKAFEPALTSVKVMWQQFDENAPKPLQAPQEIVSLFSGSRQVVYGFVPHCLQTTLKAKIGRKEVETMVSTSEMGITHGKVLHQLTARAIIRDWTDGSLDADRTQHEIIKRDRKSYIINISKEYSIVSQFTSFVAIEKREKDEKFEQSKGPSIAELVDKENVDTLQYIGWEVDQSKDLSKETELHLMTFTESVSSDPDSFGTGAKLKETFDKLMQEAKQHLQATHMEKSRAVEAMVTYYVDIEEYDKGRAVVEDYVSELSLESASEMASTFSKNVHDKIDEAQKAGRLTLVIKTLTGQTITRDLPPRATIADLKARLQKTEHIPPDQLYLLFGGKLLTDLRTLADYKMQSGDTVHMVLRLGGAPPKPKKKYKESLGASAVSDAGRLQFKEDSVALDQTGSHASDGDVPVRKMGQRKSARWSSSKSLLVSEPKRRSLSKHDTSGWFATEQHQVSEQDRSRGYLDLEPVDTNERWKTLDDEIAAYNEASIPVSSEPFIDVPPKLSSEGHFDTLFWGDSSEIVEEGESIDEEVEGKAELQEDTNKYLSTIEASFAYNSESDDIQAIMDDILEQSEVAHEISNALSMPCGSEDIDEDELLLELEQLEQEEIENELLEFTTPSVKKPSEKHKDTECVKLFDDEELYLSLPNSAATDVTKTSAVELSPEIPEDDKSYTRFSSDSGLQLDSSPVTVQKTHHYRSRRACKSSHDTGEISVPPPQSSIASSSYYMVKRVERNSSLKAARQGAVPSPIPRSLQQPAKCPSYPQQRGGEVPSPVMSSSYRLSSQFAGPPFCPPPLDKVTCMDKATEKSSVSYNGRPPPPVFPSTESDGRDALLEALACNLALGKGHTKLSQDIAARVTNGKAAAEPSSYYIPRNEDDKWLNYECDGIRRNGEDATKEKVQGHQEVVKGLDYLPSEATIKQLFQIQGTATFSWALADLHLVNLDKDKVTKLLETAGVKSLGSRAFQAVCVLIATEIMIYYIKEYVKAVLSKVVIIDEDITKILKGDDHQKFIKALEFLKSTNRKYPSLYKRLELGNSWDEVIVNIIINCHS
ncbi:protein mono-ADP-ribosyltransferase PARP4-like isoform X3 [Dysidea avara]|uniref:protein mono-ADP-ribosyltransferase PARP4-like isoform X3 n=1 Tax=Dysidea avara TaxID=196820 RepID=UPI0033204DF2